MGRKLRAVGDRRGQIIEAALCVFALKGYDRATNKDIATKAGITPGLIYHYFKSKEDLLKAAVEGYPPRQLLRSLPLQMQEMSPEALLRSFAQQILAIAEDEKIVRILRIYLPEVIHNPKLSPSGISTIQQLVKFLEQALTAKMKSGELRSMDAALTAQLFVGCIMDLVLRRQITRDPLALQYTHEQIVDGIVGMIMQGMVPR